MDYLIDVNLAQLSGVSLTAIALETVDEILT